ncbi:MAG: hypothetical protein JSU85_16245 [Candidatus Zixiibacteriota bacterium]|nr:MAG: hypothetical protein JSU85_16245 [candidate division Zixibacteria bacterium]
MLIAINLILMVSFVNLSQISAGNRIVRENEVTGRDKIVKSEHREANDAIGNDTYADNETAHDEFSLKEKWDACRYARDFSGFHPERYIASIKVDGLLRSGLRGGNSAGKNGLILILIGLKKPYYRIDRNPRVNGRVDLQISGSIFGVENAGLISFSYDFKGKDIYRRVSTSVSFNSFIYQIIIPIGPKR